VAHPSALGGEPPACWSCPRTCTASATGTWRARRGPGSRVRSHRRFRRKDTESLGRSGVARPCGPRLAGRPVVVGGDLERGAVAAAHGLVGVGVALVRLVTGGGVIFTRPCIVQSQLSTQSTRGHASGIIHSKPRGGGREGGAAAAGPSPPPPPPSPPPCAVAPHRVVRGVDEVRVLVVLALLEEAGERAREGRGDRREDLPACPRRDRPSPTRQPANQTLAAPLPRMSESP
jgi:hypothetical protein